MRAPRALVPLLAAASLAGACGKGAAPAARTRPPPLVAVVATAARDVPVEVRAPVDLRPLAQADVGSKTLGYLDAVLVDRGDRVRKGQIVALVRPSDLPDQLAAARGSLAQVQASSALARTNFERAKSLAPTAVVSQQELQQAQAGLAAAEASEEAARAQIAALAKRLGETRIESPLTGVVSARRLDPGALVGPATGSLMTVARVDVLRVFITVNEHDARGVTVGKDAYVELDAFPGRRFGGRVVRLAPTFDPTTRTLDAEVQIANDAGELRPGMYGRGSIVVETHPHAVVAAEGAVQWSDKRSYVFILEGDVVHRRAVDVGTDVDGGTHLEIKRGLAAGEEVVVAGTDGLADGMKVRVSRGMDPFTGVATAGGPQAGPTAAKGAAGAPAAPAQRKD